MSTVWDAEARWRLTLPAGLGMWAAAVAAVPGTEAKLLIAAPVVLGGAVTWAIAQPTRWVWLFFISLVLVPPVPAPFGDSGAHLAPLVALIGVAAGTLRMAEWRPSRSPLPILLLIFTAILMASSGFALLYSRPAIATGSLARVLLFCTGVYLFLYTLAGPRSAEEDSFRLLKVLFAVAVTGAAFACVDFYYQFPTPAGFGAQFVWLDEGVFRRAQGLFYEASTLGNFSAFFLVMILVAFFRPKGERQFPRVILVFGGVLFAAALILSYSRASLMNLGVACLAFLFVRGVRLRRLLLSAALALPATALLLRFTVPIFFAHYWTRIAVSFQYFWSAPDRVLSGRLATWTAVSDFLYTHPWQSVFGIGYKTLPYTDYVGGGMVADNTYLSLLVETGVVGLAAFLLLNAAVLRTAWRATRSDKTRASFFGTWIFCFWAGELVQMLSGDLITYWRVLPLYFWVLATADREASA